jgi:formylglycine-generating enzyme required for sulfatase activity
MPMGVRIAVAATVVLGLGLGIFFWMNAPIYVSSSVAMLGETWIRPIDGATMIYVPEGRFEMGSSREEVDAAYELCRAFYELCERDRFEPEGPAHTVEVYGFWIDRTEVTSAQYAAFVNEQGNQREGGVPWLDLGESCAIEYVDGQYRPKDGLVHHPVNCVSWYGAVAYSEWVGGRLPTEAEWEYAARGAQGLDYPWGEIFDGTKANFCDVNCTFEWKASAYDDGHVYSAPVGSYPDGKSWSGALDLAGNVWEWTQSLYDTYPYDPLGGREDWDVSGDRVIRGGSFSNVAPNVRGAYRVHFDPASPNERVGFRVVFDEDWADTDLLYPD